MVLLARRTGSLRPSSELLATEPLADAFQRLEADVGHEQTHDAPILRRNRDEVTEQRGRCCVRLEIYRRLAGGALPVDGCDLAGGGGVTGIGTEVSTDIAPVIAYAFAQLGKPYVWGGAGPDVFDCSGLTLRAYQQIHVNLPHNAAAQAAYGVNVDWRSQPIRPGDLIFHRGSVPVHDNGHVGIAISATQWIVAPSTGDVISIRPIPFDRIQNVRRLVTSGG